MASSFTTKKKQAVDFARSQGHRLRRLQTVIPNQSAAAYCALCGLYLSTDTADGHHPLPACSGARPKQDTTPQPVPTATTLTQLLRGMAVGQVILVSHQGYHCRGESAQNCQIQNMLTSAHYRLKNQNRYFTTSHTPDKSALVVACYNPQSPPILIRMRRKHVA
jgi:hypothetical protein